MIFHFYLFSELHIISYDCQECWKIKLIDWIQKIWFNRKNLIYSIVLKQSWFFPTLVHYQTYDKSQYNHDTVFVDEEMWESRLVGGQHFNSDFSEYVTRNSTDFNAPTIFNGLQFLRRHADGGWNIGLSEFLFGLIKIINAIILWSWWTFSWIKRNDRIMPSL